MAPRPTAMGHVTVRAMLAMTILVTVATAERATTYGDRVRATTKASFTSRPSLYSTRVLPQVANALPAEHTTRPDAPGLSADEDEDGQGDGGRFRHSTRVPPSSAPTTRPTRNGLFRRQRPTTTTSSPAEDDDVQQSQTEDDDPCRRSTNSYLCSARRRPQRPLRQRGGSQVTTTTSTTTSTTTTTTEPPPTTTKRALPVTMARLGRPKPAPPAHPTVIFSDFYLPNGGPGPDVQPQSSGTLKGEAPVKSRKRVPSKAAKRPIPTETTEATPSRVSAAATTRSYSGLSDTTSASLIGAEDAPEDTIMIFPPALSDDETAFTSTSTRPPPPTTRRTTTQRPPTTLAEAEESLCDNPTDMSPLCERPASKPRRPAPVDYTRRFPTINLGSGGRGSVRSPLMAAEGGDFLPEEAEEYPLPGGAPISDTISSRSEIRPEFTQHYPQASLSAEPDSLLYALAEDEESPGGDSEREYLYPRPSSVSVQQADSLTPTFSPPKAHSYQSGLGSYQNSFIDVGPRKVMGVQQGQQDPRPRHSQLNSKASPYEYETVPKAAEALRLAGDAQDQSTSPNEASYAYKYVSGLGVVRTPLQQQVPAVTAFTSSAAPFPAPAAYPQTVPAGPEVTMPQQVAPHVMGWQLAPPSSVEALMAAAAQRQREDEHNNFAAHALLAALHMQADAMRAQQAAVPQGAPAVIAEDANQLVERPRDEPTRHKPKKNSKKKHNKGRVRVKPEADFADEEMMFREPAIASSAERPGYSYGHGHHRRPADVILSEPPRGALILMDGRPPLVYRGPPRHRARPLVALHRHKRQDQEGYLYPKLPAAAEGGAVAAGGQPAGDEEDEGYDYPKPGGATFPVPGPPQPAEPTEPAEPAEPAEPTEPTEPTEPAEPDTPAPTTSEVPVRPKPTPPPELTTTTQGMTQEPPPSTSVPAASDEEEGYEYEPPKKPFPAPGSSPAAPSLEGGVELPGSDSQEEPGPAPGPTPGSSTPGTTPGPAPAPTLATVSGEEEGYSYPVPDRRFRKRKT